MKKAEEIIIRPRITEKASLTAETMNSYVFEVAKTATKTNIAKVIKELYKVTPVKVNIVNQAGKKVVSKGKVGKTASMKKAYVYLKKGEKIEIA